MKEENIASDEVSPVARRILAIDEEIAALERGRPGVRSVVYGALFLSLGLIVAVLALLSSGADGFRFLVISGALVVVPCAAFSFQLVRNRSRRLALERELDRLVDGKAPASDWKDGRAS